MLPNALFELFGNGVYMYGICIAVGLICCLLAFYSLSKKRGMPTVMQDYVFFVLIAGVAVGFFSAMLFQAFYNWLEDPSQPFDLFGSGLTVMGGLIGGSAAFLLLYFVVGRFYFKGKKENLHIKHFSTLITVAPICICIAHGFGRIGCLMSGCCHGAYLGDEFVFGGIRMDGTTHGWGYYVSTQLYEALFLFALAGVMTYLLLKRRSNINMPIYLIAYGIWRIIIELFRTDARGAVVLGLYPSQWQSIIFIAGGVALLIIYVIKKVPLFNPKETKEVETNIEENVEE